MTGPMIPKTPPVPVDVEIGRQALQNGVRLTLSPRMAPDEAGDLVALLGRLRGVARVQSTLPVAVSSERLEAVIRAAPAGFEDDLPVSLGDTLSDGAIKRLVRHLMQSDIIGGLVPRNRSLDEALNSGDGSYRP